MNFVEILPNFASHFRNKTQIKFISAIFQICQFLFIMGCIDYKKLKNLTKFQTFFKLSKIFQIQIFSKL